MQDPRTEGRTIGLYHATVDVQERPNGTVRYVETLTPASGAAQGWSEQAPDTTALPRRETRITRSRKGRTSYRATSAHPLASAPVGAIDKLPLVTCHEPTHVNACRCALTRSTFNEATLAQAAEDWIAEHDPDGAPLPKLIGFATTRPEMLPGDRSTVGQSAVVDDAYVAPQTVQNRRLRRAMGAPAMMTNGGRYVRAESATAWRYIVERGESGRVLAAGWKRADVEPRKVRTFIRSLRDVDDDEPTLRPASLCAVSHDDLASFLGIDARSFLSWYSTAPGRANDTDIADAWRRRTVIARRGRLGPVARKAHDIAVLAETTDVKGRKRQLLGRRTSTAVELVTFADDGYWLGHTFVPDAKRSTACAAEQTAQAAANVVKASRAEPSPEASPLRQALDAITAMRTGDRIGDVTCTAPGTYERNGVRCGTPAIAARHAMRTLS